MDTVAWWYLSCGRALGMLNGNLIEYDSSTLAPLGLVVGADELVGKKIGVINSGLDADTCAMMFDEEEGMEGADCAALAGDLREQAVTQAMVSQAREYAEALPGWLEQEVEANRAALATT